MYCIKRSVKIKLKKIQYLKSFRLISKLLDIQNYFYITAYSINKMKD